MSAPFVLGTFSVAGCTPFAGVVIGDQMIAVTALQPICTTLGRPLSAPESVLGLLQDWERNFPVLRASIVELQHDGAGPTGFVSVDQVATHAPVLYPRQVLCVAGNGPPQAASRAPSALVKLPSAITGPYDPVVIPDAMAQADGGLKLAVVIGKAARHVPRVEALGYVAGYTIANDITCRDIVPRPGNEGSGGDWLIGTSAPSFLPLGPYLVPGAFVPDPQQLRMTLRLNGEVMQDESTADMRFDVARLIEYLSANVQFWPGDVICTGSPTGNGTRSSRYLQPNDILEGTISGLGTQRNCCVAEGCR